MGERTCPSADGRWRALTCPRQVIHHAPFKQKTFCKTDAEVKGLDSRGGVTPAWSPAVETVHRKVSLHRLCSSPLNHQNKKTGYPIGYPVFLVRVKGLEPSRSCPHKNLNLTRLPIPPHPHMIITHCCEIIFISRQSSFFFSRQSVA